LVPGIFAFGSLNWASFQVDAGILVGVRIGITLSRAGVAAVEPVKLWADLVPGAFADRVARHAFIERGLAGRDILRERRGCGYRGCDDDQRAQY